MARILWVTVETPDQEGQGGQRRQYHQIRALTAIGHEISVLALKGEQNPASISALTRTSRIGISVAGHPVPSLVRRFKRRIARDRSDAMIVSHIESCWLLPDVFDLGRPSLVDVHNVVSDWMIRRGNRDAAQEALTEEAAAAARFSAIMTCSDVERERFCARHPAARPKTFTAPLGVDPDEWPAVDFDRTEPVVALFGSWGWPPNAMGLDWFRREVWPKVTLGHPDARALVAGSGTGDGSGWPVGMEAVGRVDDLARFTGSAPVVAVPVLEGVGAAVKYAESLASGAAVIATPDGANAFGETPAFVSDDPDEWAAWIVTRLGRRAEEPVPAPGRRFALSRLTWARAVEPIDAWLRDVCGEAADV